MVAQLLRLRLTLLVNSFRRSSWHVTAFIIALLYGVAAAVIGTVAFTGLRLVGVDIAATISTALGSLIVLGFIVVPLVFGIDDALDPRRFALYPIPTMRLAFGLGVAALASIPAVVLATVAVAQVITWSRGALPVFLAAVGAVLIVATCVLASRVSASLAAFVLRTRRARDASSVLAVVLLLALAPVVVWLVRIDWQSEGLQVLEAVARVAGWTPFGAVWAAPADAAAGRVGEAMLKLLIAIAFVGLLAVAWRYLVGLMLVTHNGEAVQKPNTGLGWFAAFPPTATGVIAARSLTYWGRDARYRASLMMIPIVPIVLVIPLLTAGVPAHYLALLPVPVVALFLSWSPHNDVAVDNTSIWLHLVANVRGTADRLGRVVPYLLLGVPVVIVASILTAQLYGDAAFAPSIMGVSLCILLGGLGVSSVFSARFPYQTVRPGDSPFAQPQSTATASSVIQAFSFIITILIALPPIVFAGVAIVEGGVWNLLTLAIGVVLGLIVFTVGVLWGGAIFARRAPELLAFTMRN